jgi:hypothetical protein
VIIIRSPAGLPGKVSAGLTNGRAPAAPISAESWIQMPFTAPERLDVA